MELPCTELEIDEAAFMVGGEILIDGGMVL